MAKITSALMKKIAPTISPALRDEIMMWLNFYCPKYEIVTELRLAAFFANFMEECARFSRFDENLNYSAKRLMEVWPKRFRTLSFAQQYAHNPQKLANYVYDGRNGNRPGTNDGWIYRGGGAGQTTGRGNYRVTGDHMGLDLVTQPELLRTPQYAIMSACVEWERRGCNELADARKLRATRKAINGGYNGMDNVEIFYAQVLAWLPDGFRLDNSPKTEPTGAKEFAGQPVNNDSPHTPDTVDAADAGSPSWLEEDEADTAVDGVETGKEDVPDVPQAENGLQQPQTAGMSQSADQITNVGSDSGADTAKEIKAASNLPDTSIVARVKTGFNKLWGFVFSVITGAILIPEWIRNGITLESVKMIGGFIWEGRYLIFGLIALWFVVVKFESIWIRKKVIDTNTDPKKGNVVLDVEQPSLWNTARTLFTGKRNDLPKI